MKDFFQRITSRKFLITIGGLVAAAGARQWNEFSAILIGYLVSEGAGDVVTRFRTGVKTLDTVINPMSQNIVDEDDVDTTAIITGKSTPLFDEEKSED